MRVVRQREGIFDLLLDHLNTQMMSQALSALRSFLNAKRILMIVNKLESALSLISTTVDLAEEVSMLKISFPMGLLRYKVKVLE